MSFSLPRGAVLLVGLLTVPLTGQWFLTLAYLSHILLDMLIGGKRGVASLCIGGGEATAVGIEIV